MDKMVSLIVQKVEIIPERPKMQKNIEKRWLRTEKSIILRIGQTERSDYSDLRYKSAYIQHRWDGLSYPGSVQQ